MNGEDERVEEEEVREVEVRETEGETEDFTSILLPVDSKERRVVLRRVSLVQLLRKFAQLSLRLVSVRLM